MGEGATTLGQAQFTVGTLDSKTLKSSNGCTSFAVLVSQESVSSSKISKKLQKGHPLASVSGQEAACRWWGGDMWGKASARSSWGGA